MRHGWALGGTNRDFRADKPQAISRWVAHLASAPRLVSSLPSCARPYQCLGIDAMAMGTALKSHQGTYRAKQGQGLKHTLR
jgi:hypothetical protein